MLKKKETEEKEARMNKQRPAIKNMLRGNPNVFHYTSFETADQLFAQHPIWQTVRIESERRQLFREYIADLQQREQVRCIDLHIKHQTKHIIFSESSSRDAG
jgi:pre-mRNA-processing factor 40